MASSVSSDLSHRFQTVFKEASRSTGAKFDFLLHTAQRESGMNATAKAPTSSATGLFQFVEQTWLETMKEAGPQLGYGNEAAQISKVGDRYFVRDANVRQGILDLRNDAKASALMAGAYAKKNESMLTSRLDREPTAGELYAAHFLGAQGSGKLIELAETRPDIAAAKVFPQQAAANRNIFYERNGQAKTVAEVYDNLVSTVPVEQKSPLARIFGFTNWFKPKATLPATQVEVAQAYDRASLAGAAPQQDLQAAARDVIDLSSSASDSPSRYSLGYSETTLGDASRASRLVLGDDGDLAVQVAEVRPRSSRIFTEAFEAFGDAAGKTAPAAAMDAAFEARNAQNTQDTQASQSVAATGMPLPRSRPGIMAATLTSANAYVEGMGAMLPRAKPQAMHQANTQAMTLDAQARQASIASDVLSGREEDKERKRFGALDLSAFLNGDVFGASDKG